MENDLLFSEKQHMIFLAKLETLIKSDGIYVRFALYHSKFIKYDWKDIAQAYVRSYDPISEYGGWGYRFMSFGHGKALTVMGNQGIQLMLKNGNKWLIGTQKPREADAVLKELGYLNPNDFV